MLPCLAGDPDREVWMTGRGEVQHELLADRKYRLREEADRCCALGLRGNIWRRAEQKGIVQQCRFTGGGGTGKHVYTVSEMLSADKAHADQADTPEWFNVQPCLRVLTKKTAHYLNDYKHNSFESLSLEESNGRHEELEPDDVQSLMDRLVPMHTQGGFGEFAVFGRAELRIENNRDAGVQSICSRTLETYHGYHRLVRLSAASAD